MSALQHITGAVVVAIPVGGKPFVSCGGAIFDDTKSARAAAVETIASSTHADIVYAVATIGLVDGRKA